jgi:hypothetical protein
MLEKLREADKPLSRYLLQNTSPTFQQQLKASGEEDSFDEPLKEALIVELNRIIQGPLIYEKERFDEESLKVATVGQVKANPQGIERTRLNRQLLEEAYSQELVKRPGKLKILMAVCAAGMMGMFIFIMLGALLKIEEVTHLGSLGKKIKARLKK